MSVLSGPVVFIDDQLEEEGSQAADLLLEIRKSGRPVAWATSLPSDVDEWFAHWRSLAFVVLDWDLSANSGGATGSSTLSDFERQKLFKFVRRLLAEIFCPVFIISAEDTMDILRQLTEQQEFLREDGTLDTRISVHAKSVLMGDIVAKLTDLVSQSPALTALKAWEHEYESAKNALFLDLNLIEPDWAAFVWKEAEADGVDPSFELASSINANLASRFNPVVFDEQVIRDYAGQVSGASRRRIAEGRTLIPGKHLASSTVLPGDLFKDPKDPVDVIWMNVSPACHTTGREGELVRLHVLKGLRLDPPKSKSAFKALVNSNRGPNKVLVHSMLHGYPYTFSFGAAEIRSWEELEGMRIGRLLRPYITQIQQMHGAYIQSEGVPGVTHELYLD